jgi:hypothetical protein
MLALWDMTRPYFEEEDAYAVFYASYSLRPSFCNGLYEGLFIGWPWRVGTLQAWTLLRHPFWVLAAWTAHGAALVLPLLLLVDAD